MSKKPKFLELEKIEQKSSIEALIFSSEEPISLDYMFKTLILEDQRSKQSSFTMDFDSDKQADEHQTSNTIDFSFFKLLIDEINEELLETGRSFEIINVAGGYQFATRREYGSLVHQLTKSKAKNVYHRHLSNHWQ